MSESIRAHYPVVIVGASYAGLAAAIQAGERALLIDQHAIGAIQRSACAIPLELAERFDVRDAVLQIYPSLVVHTPYGQTTFPLPSPYCIFDHTRLCANLFERSGSHFLRARVTSLDGNVVRTSEGDVRGDVLIDASGWSGALVSALRPGMNHNGNLSLGIEADIPGHWEDIHFYVDARYASDGYAWVFPAGDTLRIGVLSYQSSPNLKPALTRFLDALGYEGRPCRGGKIPWCSRPGVVGHVMAVGDAAGHCLPVTAEGIRFAMRFGTLAGQTARDITDGNVPLADGLERYRQVSRWYSRRVRAMRIAQQVIQRSPDLVVHGALRTLSARFASERFLGAYYGFGDG